MHQEGLCIFGEVLFDIFPDGNRVLGGAPFNLAWHLQAFGQPARFISRLGDDAAGREICEAMRDWGLDTQALQTDSDHPTGRVEVRVTDGEPQYRIVPDCAYDFIASEALGDFPCRLLYHGSLALRNPASAQALSRLKEKGVGTLFMDVNLRRPWWRRETVLALIDDADWVKMNAAELRLLHDGGGDDVLQAAEAFRLRHRLKGVVVTRGQDGALAVSEGLEAIQVRPAKTEQQVVDTVGAGDAFASVLVLGLMRAWPLALTMTRAQAFASMLVSRQGAVVRDHAFYRPLVDAWACVC